MRTWNHWVTESLTERQARSQRTPMTNIRKDRHTLRLSLQNRITISRTIGQEMAMFAERPVSARSVRRRLQYRVLSARRPLLYLPLTMQYEERRRLWCAKRQKWIQERHNAVFSDQSRFYLQYCYGRISVWRLRGDRASPACIQYRYRSPASGMMAWLAIEYTTRI